MKNIIIGAGPAGIQMADLLKDEEYIILEKASEVCSFLRKFPRHRNLISINKGRKLRFDWNSFLEGLSFRDYSEDLYPSVDIYLKYVEDFVKIRNIKIRYNYAVTSIEKKDGIFSINNGEYTCERVFFGIGIQPKPCPKTFAKQAYTYENMPLDKEIYRDKHVMIIGTGNAALETANYLDPVTGFTTIVGKNRNAYTSHYPGYARSVNFRALDSYFLKAGTAFIFDKENIDRFRDGSLREGLEEIFRSNLYNCPDIVIFCIGFEFNNSLVKNLVNVSPSNSFPILTPNFESTKCPGLYFIGATTQYHDYKKGTSAFIHGFRYNCGYLSRVLKGIDSQTFTLESQVLDEIAKQINRSSALFHRFDFFCDVIISTDQGFEYIKEVPIEAARMYYGKGKKYFTVHLGYSKHAEDVFAQKNWGLPKDGHKCVFIHPILKHGENEMHLHENPFNHFVIDEYYIQPIKQFIDYFVNKITWSDYMSYINSIGYLSVVREQNHRIEYL